MHRQHRRNAEAYIGQLDFVVKLIHCSLASLSRLVRKEGAACVARKRSSSFSIHISLILFACGSIQADDKLQYCIVLYEILYCTVESLSSVSRLLRGSGTVRQESEVCPMK